MKTTQRSRLWRFGIPAIKRKDTQTKRRVGGHDLNLNSRSVNSEGENSSLKIEWLTTKEAANYLKLSEGSLYNMACNGDIPHHHLGRRLRFVVGELNSFLLASKKGGRNGN